MTGLSVESEVDPTRTLVAPAAGLSKCWSWTFHSVQKWCDTAHAEVGGKSFYQAYVSPRSDCIYFLSRRPGVNRRADLHAALGAAGLQAA